jgi:hypothetical protein
MSILSDLDTLILRETSHPPLTTKGAELTFAEMDERIIAVYDAVQSIVSGANVTAYDAGTTYDQYDPDIRNRFVGYDSRIWQAAYAGSPSTFSGQTPEEGVYWTQVTLAEMLPNIMKIAEMSDTDGVVVKTAKLVIPTAQVLTLNSVPVAFGLTVPSGYYVQPISVAASLDYNSIAYATNMRVGIRFIGAAAGLSVFNNAFLSSASDAFFSIGHSSPTGTNVIVGTDLEVFVETGNPTAGNSDITIYLTYVLIEI